ncbi:DUF3164 family protein [Bowmanella denitrificans]|uniref:DUF3164 family protein n=1 Tax=Bowmanella denitrificans TaxID=366582 RepID=UPI000C9A5DF8|nr:DUF3164 family protein [Bowmanella denitrificans]
MKTIEKLYELTENNAPPGFMLDADGNHMRLDRIKDIDKTRDEVVKKLFKGCVVISDEMQALAKFLRTEVAALVEKSFAEYGKNIGGKKGNVTLFSFDRRIKIERARQTRLAANERMLIAAKLIEQCVESWTKGSNRNLQAVVKGYLRLDSQGCYSVAKLQSLRRLKIDDPNWPAAMEALADALEYDSTAEYFRVYYRDDQGVYHQLPLDMASINNLEQSA